MMIVINAGRYRACKNYSQGLLMYLSLQRYSVLPAHLLFLVLLLAPIFSSAAGDTIFLQDLTLADGRVVVVAEAELEPRSIGSYSIRLYTGANPDYRFDDFVSGIVLPRDGFVERILLEDVDHNGSAELIVVLRSVGSGSYVSARAFSIDGAVIRAVAQVDELAPGADPIERLRK